MSASGGGRRNISNLPLDVMSNIVSGLRTPEVSSLASTSNPMRQQVGEATQASGQIQRTHVQQRQYSSGLSQQADLLQANRRIQHGQRLEQTAQAREGNREYATINSQRVRMFRDYF